MALLLMKHSSLIALLALSSSAAVIDTPLTNSSGDEECNHHTITRDHQLLKIDLGCADDSYCPTWFFCNTSTRRCQCGETHHGMIKCAEALGTAAVLNCHCVTYDTDTNETQVGPCYYNCENTAKKTMYDQIYHPLPRNPATDLNDYICGRFNRTGVLCGECQDGLSPLVLSYDLRCVDCPGGHKNWWKFIVVGFLPVTFFYFFITFFNINVTSSQLSGVVLFCQALSMPALVRVLLLTFVTRSDLLNAVKIILLAYSFWNLDIFRSVIPDICLPVSPVEALTLDYIIAVYPLLLNFITYILIELYDRNVKCIVYLWKPFQCIFNMFKRTWDIRTSIIDSFTTFLLLSYVKILSVSGDLLIFSSVYSLNGSLSYRLYYDPSLVYFKGKHLIYAIPALVFLLVFTILPIVVLILYPVQLFQRFLSLFPIRWHFLHAFVDSFQGCYKDGTEPGILDCRCFAQFSFIVRFTLLALYAVTLSSMFFVFAVIILMVWLLAVINVQPYKRTIGGYLSTDVVFISMLCFFSVSVVGVNVGSMKEHKYLPAMYFVAFFSSIASLIYMGYLIIHWILSHTKQKIRCFSRRNVFV